MRRSVFLSTVALVGAMSAAQPVLAQAQGGQSVLMRRPIDNRTTRSEQSEIPPVVTPTPTPGGTTPTPTPPVVEPQFPESPSNGTVAFGYRPMCPSDGICFRMTATDDRGGYDTVQVDEALCRQPQSDESRNLAAWAGYLPGGTVSPADMCSNPNNIYGWIGSCDNGSLFKFCMGLDGSSSTLVAASQPDATCQSYVPSAAAAAILAKLGLQTNEQIQQTAASCSPTGPINPQPGPGDVPGLEDDPSTRPDDPSSGGGGGFYEWEVGQWTGGGQCGVQSTLTRAVRCVKYPYDEPVILSSVDDGTVKVSFSGEAPKMSRAIWDPSTKAGMSAAVVRPGDAKVGAINAQELEFPFPDGEEKLYVAYEECRNELGYAPPNRYVGTQANCDYEKEKVSDGDWTNPFGGSATCSANAIRIPEYRCVSKSTGEEVDLGVCANNLKDGGSPDDSMVMPERGNYSGCTASWQTESYEIGCHTTTDPNSPEGPILLNQTQSRCVRSDGTVLEGVDEAACSASDRPMDGVKEGGSCYRTFDQSVWDGLCLAHKPGNSYPGDDMTSWRTVIFDGSMYSGGAKACVESGATCCQERYNYTNGKVETVGSNRPIEPMSKYYGVGSGGRGIYMDDGTIFKYAGTVTYPPYQDEPVLDHASPVRITGSKNGYTCPYEVGKVMARCGGFDFMCTYEDAYEGWPPPLMQCEPSTIYYNYSDMQRSYPQGGSGIKWSSQPPRSQ